MCLQDGAYGALAAPHHRRLLMVTQQLQPAAAAAVTIAAAMTMLLVAAVMCLRWRRRFLQQQPQQQQDKDLQHKKVQQACNSSHSKCSGSLTKQQQQQCGECVSAASRHCSSRGCSPSSAPAATSAAAAADASKDSVQLTVLPLGPEAYNYSRATGTRSKMQHRLPCIASDRSTSSSGRSDSAASIEAALVASQGNDAAAVAAAASSSAAAASSASAVSNSTDSLGPLTSMLTEANLLRCVTPDNDNNCYNSHVIFIPDSQLGNLSPEAAAAAAAASSSAQHDALMRQLHGSAASSASGSTQLRGVNAALFRLEASEEDARGMPAVVLGTLSRAQAAAIKFGRLVGCSSCSRVYRAKLGQQDIAVRVINHSSNSLEAVSEMLKKVLSMQHPHVNKAHAFVTWATPCAPEAPSSCHQAAATGSSSSSCCGGVSIKESACSYAPMAPTGCFASRGLNSAAAAAAPAGNEAHSQQQQQQQQQQLGPEEPASPDSLGPLLVPPAAPKLSIPPECSLIPQVQTLQLPAVAVSSRPSSLSRDGLGFQADNGPDSLGCSSRLFPDSLGCSSRVGPDSLGCSSRACPDSLGCSRTSTNTLRISRHLGSFGLTGSLSASSTSRSTNVSAATAFASLSHLPPTPASHRSMQPASLDLGSVASLSPTEPCPAGLLSPGCPGRHASSSLCSSAADAAAAKLLAADSCIAAAAMHGADPQAIEAVDRNGGLRCRLGSNQLETWVIEDYCYAGSLQQAVQQGGMQRFQEDGIPQMGPLLEQLLGIAKGIDYLHSSDWVVGDLRACNVLLTHAHHQHAASTAAAAAAVAGATSSSPAALAAPSPRVPAGIMQQQQQQQGLTLHRAGSLPCSPQAQMQQQPLLQRAGSLGLAAQQQHHSMSRDDSAGAVTMRLVPKVADLGIGRVVNEGAKHLSTHTLGAVSSQAPEVMKTGVLSKPGDVYAFGMLMFEAIMGCEPWKNKCIGEIINLVLVEQARPKFTAKVPKGYSRLAASCWQESPSDRPTFEQLVLLLEQMRSEAASVQVEVNAACGSYLGYFST